MSKAQRRSLLLITLLGLYIVMQFTWWAILLVRKETQLAHALDPAHDNNGGHLERTYWMIIGEGIVFLTLIGITLWLLHRGMKRELATARMQRNFLLAAGHELRTPIASLQLQLQTMARPGLAASEHDELHRRALDDVQRLGGLAEKVLLATRLEETGVPLQPSKQRLHELVGSICEHARATYAQDHTVVTDLKPMELSVDPQALRSVLVNLLENAAKYSPSGTTISIDLGIVGSTALLRVSDDGPGVPVADRAHIFTKFFRGGNEETRNVKGTGLGLYIVQRLMQAMGGSVHLEPRAGGGSTFAAAFPLHK
ncbi:MAG: hypothetical protein IPO17_06920 [Flavobacteriales bacterium]|nr:hypothetical protein [Flavobacteriales bacterium]